MKKFLAIYGLGFVAGIVTIEWVKLWFECIKLEQEALQLSNEIHDKIQNLLLSHPEWQLTEDQKKQFSDMGFTVK